MSTNLACTPHAIRRQNPTPVAGVALPKSLWSTGHQAVHVLNRLAYGPSPDDLKEIERLGVAEWIDRQLHPDWIPDPAVTARLRELPTLTLTASQLYEKFPPPLPPVKAECETPSPESPAADPSKQIPVELFQAKLARAVESRRQLQEVLVDFWFNHFNVSIDKGQDKWMVTSYERDAIRPHVFGTFRDLLRATAHHPAMMFYLDNWLSRGPKPAGRSPGLNENYARELLELHTLGVNGGYTQMDVREVARCFTGWSIDMPRYIGDFVFREKAHDRGPKVVLGMTIPPGGGQEDGEKVLELLATHPSTARFIAEKLTRKFVSDQPPLSLVDKVARVFLETGGHLPSLYATIFSSNEFWSDRFLAAKTKTPLEFVVSAVRGLGGASSEELALAQAIDRMGEPLYRSPAPTGYSESAEGWVNAGAMVNRMNFGFALAANRIPGTKIDLAPFGKSPIESLSRALLGRPATAATKSVIRQALASSSASEASPTTAQSFLVAALLIGSPEFQKR